jgi:seryl-tRNA synthetase
MNDQPENARPSTNQASGGQASGGQAPSGQVSSENISNAFRDALIANGIFIPMGVDGLFARDARFEDTLTGLEALITRIGAPDKAEFIRFPPVMTRTDFEQSGYMQSFPQLAGTIHCFCGDERAHRNLLRCMDANEDWTAGQQAADVVLAPAACYPLYPVMARRGALPEGGHLVDLQSWCFRHEPSLEPTRLQMFRLREWVRFGNAEQVLSEREAWMQRGKDFFTQLQLPFEIDVANDPFFGRAGTLMANSQREQAHKFELLVPVNDGLGPTACMSFNYHVTKFGDTFGLRTHDGEVAHSACVGFGLERIVVALFKHHGFEPSRWPDAVQRTLEPVWMSRRGG